MGSDHSKALDLARDGSWDKSHQLVQQYSDKLSCLIHAYLHRVEGDLSNTQYWYDRANEDMPNNTLEEELNRLYEMTSTLIQIKLIKTSYNLLFQYSGLYSTDGKQTGTPL